MSRWKTYVLLIAIALAVCYLTVEAVHLMYPKRYDDYVTKYAKEFGVEEELVFAVIKAESNFKSRAVSKRDAVGLMQILKPTGEWIAEMLGETEYTEQSLSDAKTNIRYGVYYLSYLLEMFGDEECAIAAYNAGHTNVKKWLSEKKFSKDGKTLRSIPFAETATYVERVRQNKEIYRFLYKDE